MGFLKSIVDFIPNIINAGAQIHATNAQARMAKYNTDQTNMMNQKMAEYQYNKNLEMWNMQNQYNSPQSQMSRYSQAGLNPNLIYGQGTPGNAVSSPKYEAPHLNYNYQARNFTGVLSAFQNIEMRQAQIDQVKASIENTKAKTINEGLMTALRGILKEKGLTDLKYYDQHQYNKTMLDTGKYQLMTGQGELMKYQTDIKKKYLQWYDKVMQNTLDRTSFQNAMTQQQTELVKKQLSTYDLGMLGKYAPGFLNIFRGLFK